MELNQTLLLKMSSVSLLKLQLLFNRVTSSQPRLHSRRLILVTLVAKHLVLSCPSAARAVCCSLQHPAIVIAVVCWTKPHGRHHAMPHLPSSQILSLHAADSSHDLHVPQPRKHKLTQEMRASTEICWSGRSRTFTVLWGWTAVQSCGSA